MKKHLVILIMICMSVFWASCGRNLVGTWVEEKTTSQFGNMTITIGGDDTWEFKSNGTCTISYTAVNNKRYTCTANYKMYDTYLHLWGDCLSNFPGARSVLTVNTGAISYNTDIQIQDFTGNKVKLVYAPNYWRVLIRK